MKIENLTPRIFCLSFSWNKKIVSNGRKNADYGEEFVNVLEILCYARIAYIRHIMWQKVIRVVIFGNDFRVVSILENPE
jgi:hypothetical protein